VQTEVPAPPRGRPGTAAAVTVLPVTLIRSTGTLGTHGAVGRPTRPDRASGSTDVTGGSEHGYIAGTLPRLPTYARKG
jgi:hypothetical protein